MERLKRAVEDLPTTDDWWGKYSRTLEASALTATGWRILEIDSRYIFEQGVSACGDAGDPRWPVSRYRSGLVLGAIQSGKTASMLGVVAQAMDSGVDIVLILAGTRVALWRQTYLRGVSQLGLDAYPLLVPPPRFVLSQSVPVGGPKDLYQVSSSRAARALRERAPLVMVVMKHGDHLRSVARFLHERVYVHLDQLGRDVHLLVLDDEADDGSVLDAVVENELDPAFDAFKQIPRHIANLWSTRSLESETAHPRLFASYVAYTATPQANFLQSDLNPLAPTAFIAALRTPSDTGTDEPRSPTYLEPAGLAAYYTGGEAFYRRVGGGHDLVIEEPDHADEARDGFDRRREWIQDALRAYLVAGAARLLRDPLSRRLSDLRGRTFSSRDEAEAASPPPHTMLFHPSAGVRDHFEAAAELLSWSNRLTMDDARAAILEGRREVSADGLLFDMRESSAAWKRWLDSYRESASSVVAAYGLERTPECPSSADWEIVQRLILTELLPSLRLAVVNSDPEADDRPEFEPQAMGTEWRAARDLCTVFVSGNVMARGLTLEGLTTTLFLRGSGDPVADSQMQMQRWFGYRGGFLDLCRVFAPRAQLSLFRRYHEGDEALRLQVIAAMNETPGSAPSPLVIEGADFRATGKITGINRVPLCPGASPFVDLVNDGGEFDPNMRVLGRVFSGPSDEVEVGGTIRGRILGETLSLSDAANMLDQFSYASYRLAPDEPSVQRWGALERQIGLDRDESSPLRPLFRGPLEESLSGFDVNPSHCPYTIAAYLRFWAACLDRHARGLFSTDDGETPWAYLDLEMRRRLQPRFYVGIRYGSGDPERLIVDDNGTALSFDIKPMRRSVREGRLTSTWGTRNPSGAPGAYLSDQLFDYHHHGETPVPIALDGQPLWRPVGSPGLLLFHVIRDECSSYPVVALGAAVPLGGPDHFASRRPRAVAQ